jgi:hypothetical protein
VKNILSGTRSSGNSLDLSLDLSPGGLARSQGFLEP